MFTLNPEYALLEKTESRTENRVGNFFLSRWESAERNEAVSRIATNEKTVIVTVTVSGLCFWLNRDPIAEDGGLNLYGFVGNDGVNFIDILGNEPLQTSIGELDTEGKLDQAKNKIVEPKVVKAGEEALKNDNKSKKTKITVKTNTGSKTVSSINRNKASQVLKFLSSQGIPTSIDPNDANGALVVLYGLSCERLRDAEVRCRAKYVCDFTKFMTVCGEIAKARQDVCRATSKIFFN